MPPVPRPLLLGHRGARVSGIPENTFAAFDLCLEKGCHGFEFDVRCTRDGRLIICHDSDFFGSPVASSTYADLQQNWDRAGIPKLLYQKRADVSDDVVEISCLQDVLSRYADCAFIDIELKASGMQKAVIAAVRENPPKRGYVVSSFLPEVLFELLAESPSIPLGFICDKKEELARWPTLPVQFVIPHYKLLSQKLLDELHAAGKKVFVWTVNDRRDMTRFAGWGVDAIISDDPEILAAQISS
jgi:glycerophosphoryl diester phosphodiesterase